MRKVGSTTYCYDANGNMVKRGSDDITWYSYNLPNLIEMGSNASQLYYGADRGRYKQVSTNGSVTQTTLYVAGLFEKVTESGQPTVYRHMIEAAGHVVAQHLRYSSGSPATVYPLLDHLGGVDKVTDSAGGTQVALSFDAFGKRRDEDWVGDPDTGDWTQINATTRRGFTGHEHLDSVSLVHMNGRVYDPLIGRFTSADPTIPELFNPQGLNRYSYVINDPLSLVDPSGFGWWSDFVKWIKRDGGGSSNPTRYSRPPPSGTDDEMVVTAPRLTSSSGSFGDYASLHKGDSQGRSDFMPERADAEVATPAGKEPDISECDMPLPDRSTVRDNVRELNALLGALLSHPRSADLALLATMGTWVGRVAPGGSWDYKLQPGGTERMGNFNFGATGSLILAPRVLLSGAGVIQLATLPSASDGGVPFVSPPYGDQIRDQNDIKAGIAAGCR